MVGQPKFKKRVNTLPVVTRQQLFVVYFAG